MIASKDGGASLDPGTRSTACHVSRGTTLLEDALQSALERTKDWLVERQSAEGFWVGELEGDTILESEYILLMAFLGREREPVCLGCARYIQDQQSQGGGWAIYPGGPTDVSASVKAYFALKLAGISPDDPAMQRARQAIFGAGGAHACNSFTRFYLALLGQIDYDECPLVPPEVVLIPARWNFSLHAMSAWTRTIVVPLSIMSYYKPVRNLGPERGISELFRGDKEGRARGCFPGRASFWASIARSSGWIAGFPPPGGGPGFGPRTSG